MGPRLERPVVCRFNAFDGYVLVSAKGSNNGGFVSEDDLVGRVGREKTLEKSDSRIEDDRALTAGLGVHMDLMGVHEVGLHVRNV